MHLQKLDKLLEVHIFMAKKGQMQRKHSNEFKISVIMDMREHRYGYRETARKYELGESGSTVDLLKRWKRIYLEEGVEGFMKERPEVVKKVECEKAGMAIAESCRCCAPKDIR